MILVVRAHLPMFVSIHKEHDSSLFFKRNVINLYLYGKHEDRDIICIL